MNTLHLLALYPHEPLHPVFFGVIAAITAVHNLVRRLLQSRKRDGATALHLAAAKGLGPMCQLLLQHGADPRATNQVIARAYMHMHALLTPCGVLRMAGGHLGAGSGNPV